VTIDGETITATTTHPFYVEGYGFKPTGELVVGEKVRLLDGGSVEVEDVVVEHLDEPVKVYNFEVEDWHTYYVTGAGVLVHNEGCNKQIRLPKSNGYWEGDPGNGVWHSDIKAVNKVTGNEGIPFYNGRPDFSKWSKGNLKFKKGELNGTRQDFKKVYERIKEMSGGQITSNSAAKRFLRRSGLTPHHFSDVEIQLIPTALHGNIPHIGSASDLRGGFN